METGMERFYDILRCDGVKLLEYRINYPVFGNEYGNESEKINAFYRTLAENYRTYLCGTFFSELTASYYADSSPTKKFRTQCVRVQMEAEVSFSGESADISISVLCGNDETKKFTQRWDMRRGVIILISHFSH